MAIKRKREYDLYRLWLSLPPFMLGLSEDELKKKFGIDSEQELEVLGLKTQKAFAQKYNLAEDTLTNWNQKVEAEGNPYIERSREWAQKLNKNVVFSLYNKIMRKPDPVSIELWFKAIDGWNEKTEIKHTGQLTLVELARAKRAEKEKKKKNAK